MRWICALVLLLAPVAVGADTPPPALVRGLTLFDSFNASTKPEYTAGADASSGNCPPADGRVGHGIQFGVATGITFQSQLNLDQTAGTLCFWFKPDSSYFKRSNSNRQTLFSLANSNFQLVADPADQIMFFMTGTQLPGHDFEWDYASQFGLDKLTANRWTHIALTWNADTGEKRIFLDGKLVRQSITPLMRRGSIDSEFHFATAPGCYDELAIWNRVLSAADIAAIVADPASLSAAVATLPRTAADNPWKIYPGLVYTTFTQPLLSPGESLQLKIPLTNRDVTAAHGRITARCIDLWDQPAGQGVSAEMELNAGESRDFAVALNPKKLGVFRVEVQIEVGSFKRLRDVASFAVLPAGSPPAHPFFGAHVNGAADIPQACRRLGFTSNRVHNMTQFTWWVRMQPTPDRWAMIDSELYDRYNALGFTHLGQWFAAPNWAVAGPNGEFPPPDDGYPQGWVPTDVDALRAYVRESLKRFPLIHDWEIWNEPHVSMFWYGTPKQYAELCAIIYDQAKKVRPDITVYAQVNPGGPWARAAFAAGVMDHCDGISFHYYADYDADPQSAAHAVQQLRELVKKYSKKDPATVPLIQSEGAVVGSTFLRGLDFPGMVPESRRPPLTARQAAAMIVKSRVVLLSCGVKRDYYYLAMPYTPPLHDDFSLFDVTNGPKPKAVALNQLIWQLDGGTFNRQLDHLPAGLRAYLFHRGDGKTLAVLFAENGASFELPPVARAFDLMGNPLPQSAKVELDGTPIYVVGTADLQAQLSAAAIKVKSATVARAAGQIPQPKHMDNFPVAIELGRDRLLPVDLSALVNASLADAPDSGKRGWTNEGAFNDARMIPNGANLWLGVPTLIAGKTPADNSVITLFGRNSSGGPKSVTIPLHDSKARGLFFTHAATWAADRIGEYVITYADGQQITLPIVVGQDIGDWWSDQTPGEESRTIAFKHPDPLSPDQPYRFVRMWYWENPRSNEPIRSVEIRKTSDTSNLVLLGLTRATW